VSRFFNAAYRILPGVGNLFDLLTEVKVTAVHFTAGLIAVLTLVAVCPTRADWQYTKWGMTPEQVIEASKGVAVPNKDRSLDAADGVLKTELVAPYQAGAFKFKAGFMFGVDKKLKVVMLTLQSDSCEELFGSLTTIYGPEQSKNSTIYTWWDQKHGNRVNYYVIGSNCWVQYKALSMPGKPGGL